MSKASCQHRPLLAGKLLNFPTARQYRKIVVPGTAVQVLVVIVRTFHCGFAATVANDRGALDRSPKPVAVDGFVFFIVHLHLFALSKKLVDAQRTRTGKSSIEK